MNTVSEALATEVQPFGIRVVLIEPGFIDTAINANNLDRDQELEGPYARDEAWIHSYYDASIGNAASPRIVADVIVHAATDPSTRLLATVGDDAEMLLGLLAQSDGFEGFMGAVIPVVEEAVGPRPAPIDSQV